MPDDLIVRRDDLPEHQPRSVGRQTVALVRQAWGRPVVRRGVAAGLATVVAATLRHVLRAQDAPPEVYIRYVERQIEIRFPD